MNRITRFVAIASLLVSGVLVPQGVSQAQVSNTWSSTGQMTQARTGAAAVLLTDGQILITGGANSSGIPQATAELYNPATGAFTAVPAMNIPRANHAAIVLVTGDVLVTGGLTTGGGYSDSAEIFSASSQQWTLLNSSLGTGLAGQTMATLSDGNILIAGGTSTAQVVGSLVLYNFTDQTFTPIATLLTPRTGAVAAATPDGRVLIAGGADINGAVLSSTEIFVYSPTTLTGTVSAGPAMSFPRVGATATGTYDGVAVIGGNNGQNDLGTAEIFSQWTNTFKVVSGGVPRSDHFAALLPKNGAILATGGTGGTAVDLLQPWANSTAGAFFAVSPSLLNLDGGFASPAGPGSLLAAGGTGSNASAAELYAFPTISTDRSEYPPGTPVLMTGAGFQPFEEVNLHIHEWVNQTTEDDPEGTATADTFGNFTYNKYAPDSNDVGARYHLTAVGLSSGYQAQTIFGDSIKTINFSSPTLDQPAGPASPTNQGACGEITLTVTESSGTYGAIYLYDGDLGNGTGNFYLNQANCEGGTGAITSIPAADVSATTTFWYENNTAGTPALYADSASGIPFVQCLLGAICTSQTESIYSSPTQLSFAVQPGGGGPGNVWTNQPVVDVQDKNGNTVTSSSAPITLTLSTDPGGGVLSCATNPLPATSGVATFSQCSINMVASTCYVITATSPGLTSAVSGCINIATSANAGTSTVIASPTSATDSGVVQSPCTTSCSTITVTLKDVNGNPLAGKAVTLTAGSGNSIISAASGVSSALGVVTFTVTDAFAQVVTYTATDTTDGVVITETATVTFTVGAVSAGKSTVTASPTSAPNNGTATSTITVTLLDSTGNPVSGQTVTLADNGTACTTPPTGACISAASGLSSASGVVTFTVTDTTAQTVTYTATAGSVTLSTKPTVVWGATAPTLVFYVPNPNPNGVELPPTSAAEGATFTVDAEATNSSPADAGTITYSATGSCTVGINSGIVTMATGSTTACVITANIAASGSYVKGSISATVTVTPATSMVTFNCTVGAPFIYNGSAQTPCTAAATSTTDPSLNQQLTVTYTNNTNAGTATASASFGGDANDSPSSGSTNFTIEQATPTVTVTCTAGAPYIYNGSAQSPCTATATNAITGLNQSLTPTYLNNTDAGTATANATYGNNSTGNYSLVNASSTFTIAAATSTVTVTCPASVVYNGTAQTPCTATANSTLGPLSTSPVTLTITYSNNTNAGSTATATAGYNGGSNGDYTVSSGSGTFTITQAAPQTVTITCPASVPYNGTAQTPCTASITPVGEAKQAVAVTYTNNIAVGTNTATANAAYAGDTNNAPSSATPVTFSIVAAPVTATAGSFTGVYNGTAGTISPCLVTGTYTGTLSCTNSVTSVGPGVTSGTVTATAGGDTLTNYTITYVPGSYSITPAPVTATAGSYSGVYTGTAATIPPCVVSGPYTTGVTCTDNPTTEGPAVGAGTITPTYANNSNFTITPADGTWSITTATSTVKVTCNPTSVGYTGAAQTPCTATVTGAGGLSLTEPSSSLVFSNNTNEGTASATYTYAGDSDHAGSTNTATFTITSATPTLLLTCPQAAYTGNPQNSCTGTATGIGGATVTGTFSYSPGSETNVGSYPVTGTFTSTNTDYQGGGTASGTLVITPASTQVSINCPASTPYTGSPVTPCTATVTGPGGLNQSVTSSLVYSNNTAVGTATVSASYAGAANYGGSGTATNFTITQATGLATTTTVSCPTSVVYNGAAQTPCTATVTGSGGFSMTLTPVYLSNTNVGMATANAAFAGNATYAGSTGTQQSFSITPAPVTATAGSLNASYTGSAQSPSACVVTGTYTGGLTCTDSPSSVGPAVGSGTVTPTYASNSNFTITPVNGSWNITAATLTTTVTTVSCSAGAVYDGAAQTPCTATVTGAGGLNQSLTVTYTNNINAGTGTATASASYAGNTTYAASNGSATFTISPAPVTATAGSLNAAANGSAQSPSACVVTGAYTGTLTCTDSPSSVGPGVGTGTVTPTYTSNSNFNITPVNGTWTITSASLTSTVTTVSCPPSVTYNGAAQTPACTATVTGAGGFSQSVTPVTYSNNTNAGTAGASASFAGNTTYAASNGSTTFTINPAPVTATAGSLNAAANGSAQSVPACVVTGAYTGTLTCTDSPSSVGPGVGTGTVTPTYTSDSNFTVTPVNGTWTITSASLTSTVTTVSCPASVVYSGLAETPCTATVTGAGGLNTSLTVTYTNNINTGTATASASYAGNSTYAPSSNSTTFAITSGSGTVSPTATTVSCPASVVYDAAAQTPCTATVTGVGGLNQSLTVTYASNTNAGTATASASYPGDANYMASSNSANFTIAQAGTTTSLNASSSSVTPGQVVTLTAQVVSVTSGTPTGSVAFYDGTTLLGTEPLIAGTATLSTSSLTDGTVNSLNAVYSGDNNFTASQSSTSVTVGSLDFTLTVSGSASATVFPGSAATYQVIANPLYGSYPGPVSFTASGLPTGATATFSPSTIATNGGMQTVTLTVSTPAVAKEVSPSIGRRLVPLTTLALLLFPLLGVGRLRRQGRRLSRLASLLLLLGCTLAGALMTGCSSPGSGFFSQAVQSYTINVTATSGNVQHAAAVTLVVE